MVKSVFGTTIVCLCLAVASGCGSETTDSHETSEGAESPTHSVDAPRVTSAVVVLTPAEGSDVRGTLYFVEQADGLHISGEVSGLEPGSAHGFHVHEFGDLTSPDGTSLGGHFNPAGVEHGLPGESDVRHKGDLGNIVANDEGVARVDATFSEMSLNGAASVLGRGIVVHEKADDGGQPVGNAGGRIAFGVIGVAFAQ